MTEIYESRWTYSYLYTCMCGEHFRILWPCIVILLMKQNYEYKAVTVDWNFNFSYFVTNKLHVKSFYKIAFVVISGQKPTKENALKFRIYKNYLLLFELEHAFMKNKKFMDHIVHLRAVSWQ